MKATALGRMHRRDKEVRLLRRRVLGQLDYLRDVRALGMEHYRALWEAIKIPRPLEDPSDDCWLEVDRELSRALHVVTELHEIKVLLVRLDTRLRQIFGILKFCEKYGNKADQRKGAYRVAEAAKGMRFFTGVLPSKDCKGLDDAVSAWQGQMFTYYTHLIRRALGRDGLKVEVGYGDFALSSTGCHRRRAG